MSRSSIHKLKYVYQPTRQRRHCRHDSVRHRTLHDRDRPLPIPNDAIAGRTDRLCRIDR